MLSVISFASAEKTDYSRDTKKMNISQLCVKNNPINNFGIDIKNKFIYSKINVRNLDWKNTCKVEVTVIVQYGDKKAKASSIVPCEEVEETEVKLTKALTKAVTS